MPFIPTPTNPDEQNILEHMGLEAKNGRWVDGPDGNLPTSLMSAPVHEVYSFPGDGALQWDRHTGTMGNIHTEQGVFVVSVCLCFVFVFSHECF